MFIPKLIKNEMVGYYIQKVKSYVIYDHELDTIQDIIRKPPGWNSYKNNDIMCIMVF